MIDIRPVLRSFLLGYSPISTMVGGQRLYAIKIPQGVTADSIVFNRISGSGTYIMEGLSGFTIQRFQFDAWSLDPDKATTLGDLIRDRMDGFRGTMGDSPATAVVHGVFMVDQRDNYDDQTKMTALSRDYQIAFKELV